MYRNWNKKIAQRYLLGNAMIFVSCFLLTLVLIIALSGRDDIQFGATFVEKLLLSLVCALVPSSSFTGFCVGFIRIENLSMRQIILMVIFCVPMVILSVPFGFAMTVPTVVKSAKLLQNT